MRKAMGDGHIILHRPPRPLNEPKPGCIHCGHHFDKSDTEIIWRKRWRVHRECAESVDTKGHQLEGCTGCYVRRAKEHG